MGIKEWYRKELRNGLKIKIYDNNNGFVMKKEIYIFEAYKFPIMLQTKSYYLCTKMDCTFHWRI